MKEEFVYHNFRDAALSRIAEANDIIGEYERAGLTLTLRQLYYQFVARGIIENSERSYKSLGNTISKGREAGLISWTAIEDRGRNARRVQGDHSVQQAIDGLEHNIALDPWEEQDFYVEVWIEKDALIGTISGICNQFRVTNLACKGYLSASEAWRAGKRFQRASREGKDCVLIHLGDHDPSGIDMTRDNDERSNLFSRNHVEVRRIALNMDQVRAYNPPPNPAKMSDARAGNYVDLYGYSSWELDALEPKVLSDLVKNEIETCISSWDEWDEKFNEEERLGEQCRKLQRNWTDVEEFLTTLD